MLSWNLDLLGIFDELFVLIEKRGFLILFHCQHYQEKRKFEVLLFLWEVG